MTKTSKTTPNALDPKAAAAASQTHATRETIESIVIAFVLAFLFRTFEAEAFVIPTGSMANTLMGRHKDVDCAKCGYRYQVSASEEVEEAEQIRSEIRGNEYQIADIRKNLGQFRDQGEAQREIFRLQKENENHTRSLPGLDIVGGVCPICRFAMPMGQKHSPTEGNSQIAEAPLQRSYNGDRILVNKYLFTFRDPRRWEVVVFHFPGNAEQNYIKRLVGLPGEILRIYQGDLHVGKPVEGGGDPVFVIARKPADTVLATRQLVHDTDYDPAELHRAGWPLRWKATPEEPGGWQVATEEVNGNVQQRYTVDQTTGGTAWLRYFHTVPNERAWQIVGDWQPSGGTAAPAVFPRDVLRPELITDFCAYNTRVKRNEADNGSLWPRDGTKLGMHWVGDLMVEANVDVLEPKGELLLSLVEAGKHFGVRIDLASGVAKLEIEGLPDYAPQAKTTLSSAGEHRVALANVDDQLLLWIDGKLIEFDQGMEYDARQVFGQPKLRPQTTGDESADKLDLSPVAIGAKGAKLAVSRLQVWRDFYYIAISSPRSMGGGGHISDFDMATEMMINALRYDPSQWDIFLRRRAEDFPLADGQFFVLGDNSAASSDARLWLNSPFQGGKPGGSYLERKMLIGKAICVYWPHAAYSVFGIPVVPNIPDMRLVR